MTAEVSGDVGGNEGLASGNIGNYKGVMLCNRPKEPGEIHAHDRQGPLPFLSRVEKHEALGINLPKREFIIPKKPDETQEVLIRHRKFIEELSKKKKEENIRKLEEETKMKKHDVKVEYLDEE